MAARFAHSWDVTDYEIERLCAYLDDAKIAEYFSIDAERVAHVRAKMTRGDRFLRAVADCTAKSEEVINASTRLTEAKAKEGSAMLLERISGFYRRFAKKHGLDLETAQRLQLSGYRA
jgi:hypothetical protein